MSVPSRPGEEYGIKTDIQLRSDYFVELQKAYYHRGGPFNRLFAEDLIREAVHEYIENGDHWGDVDPGEIES